MPSTALAGLLAGLAEIDALQRANPTPVQGSGLTRPSVVRALGRSEVVLLSSHFERYIYALVEEAVEHVHLAAPSASVLPITMRLYHSKVPVDELAETAWINREAKLRSFAAADAALWLDGATVTGLDHERLLAWMKAPKCKELVRAFKMWGIANIFDAITRTSTTRHSMWLRIEELVEKRNAIAHGDLTTEATHLDIRQYKAAVKVFCERTDARMSRVIQDMCASAERPW